MKKLILCVLALSVFIGASLMNSTFAALPEMYASDQNFDSMSNSEEVTPEAIPALAVVGAKVVGGAFIAGFCAAAGAWAFDKVTGYFEVQQQSYDNSVEVIFNK